MGICIYSTIFSSRVDRRAWHRKVVHDPGNSDAADCGYHANALQYGVLGGGDEAMREKGSVCRRAVRAERDTIVRQNVRWK